MYALERKAILAFDYMHIDFHNLPLAEAVSPVLECTRRNVYALLLISPDY